MGNVKTCENRSKEIQKHIPELITMCEQSRKRNIEIGLTFYCDEKGTKVDKYCIGKKCEIKITPSKIGEHFGSAHSHPPPGGNIPSFADLEMAIRRKDKVMCICGVEKKNNIACYELNTDLIKEINKGYRWGFDVGSGTKDVLEHWIGWFSYHKMNKNEALKLLEKNFNRDPDAKFMKKNEIGPFSEKERIVQKLVAEAYFSPSKKTIFQPIFKIKIDPKK